MLSSGTVDRCLDPLRAAGLAPPVFAETVPDPTDTVIEAGVAALRAGDYDCLSASAAAARWTPPRPWRSSPPPRRAEDARLQGAGPGGPGRVPVICIPTTAGTGSEATRFTVITDTETDEKMLIAGLGALPLAAIVDYELTFSVPQRTTADTGIDSLTHALEAYVSKRANPSSDSLALSAMR